MAGSCEIMSERWLVLIYIIPSDPTRLRASIWRELKRVGAVYLRDGVAVLPEREATIAALRATAARVEELGGQATLIDGVQLDERRVAMLVAASRQARSEEYWEIARETEGLLDHARQETTHREFTF